MSSSKYNLLHKEYLLNIFRNIKEYLLFMNLQN